jgi:putative tricarboxylic transport membrane protein
VAMALVGLLLATVGLDPMTATPRFTYGTITLMDGIGLVPIIMGLFGVAEVLLNIEKGLHQDIFKTQVRGLLPNREQWRASAGPIARGTVLGFFLGILPGIGSIVPTFLAYALEKRIARHPERFGRGAIEGVAGPESANNADAQCKFIPMLTLGLPASGVMALMLGALTIQGIQPGPEVMTQRPELFWGLVASMWIGNLMLVVLNLPLVGVWVKLLMVPYRLLFPAIMAFSAIGIYSVNNSSFEIYLTALFGVLGFVWTKLGFPAPPLLLGFVLGPMMEEHLRRAMLTAKGDPTVFVTRPISLAFIMVTVLILVVMVAPVMNKRRGEITG